MKILTQAEMLERIAKAVVDNVQCLADTALAAPDGPTGASLVKAGADAALSCIRGVGSALPAFQLTPGDPIESGVYVDDVNGEVWPMEPIDISGLGYAMHRYEEDKTARADQISHAFTENISEMVDRLTGDADLNKAQALERLGEHVAVTIDRYNGFVRNSGNKADAPTLPVVTGANLTNRDDDLYARQPASPSYVAGEFADDYRRARTRARQARIRSIEHGKGENPPTIV